FGRSLDTEKSINNRFISLIHAFLNTISCLIYLLKTDSSESFSSTSFFSPFNCHLSIEDILSPLKYIDEWTWLLEKWRIALETFPIELTNQGAFGRLVRTTIGVGIARLYGFAINDEHDELDEKFFQALQMGFYYGIAYALVDGLQDNQEQIDIDTWLKKMEDILCGSEQLNLSLLPELPITPLLLETFHSLIQLTSENFITVETFTDLALLLRSQRIDKKDLNRSDYTDIDIFIGPLLKAHFTYTATVYMSGAKILTNDQRLWLMPFLGQLTDDCRDFHEDRQTKSVTPVTYYAQHNGVTLNPFFVFLFICENLYLESDRENNTGAFLGRRIMRTLRAIGSDLKEFLQIFTSTSYPDLCKYCLSLEYFFNHISDPEKTIFRHINTFAKNYSYNHRTLETFAYDYLPIIEKELFIDTNNDNNPLIHGMNHSLKAGGKRLRPLILLMVAQLYNIDIKRILPLARAIEYLHTSSLIFDDLPAQDNAPLRRGKPTLHMTIDSDYNNIPSSLTEGRAQLAAIDLIGYAIQLVTIDLHNENFSYESINRVTAELAQSMKELCYGQFLDLQSARNEKLLTINELDRIAYLKTGKAIEVTLICPVLLIEQKQSLDELRQLGRLMGILFQMKDDLLDIEGHTDQLGKLQNIDQQNQTITYINLLGIEGTRQRIREIRKQAELILDNLWPQSNTIRDLLRFGRSLDTEKSINNRFISLIHAFLNTISCLIYLLKTDSSESFSSTSLFSPFNCDLSTGDILSPLKYIDEWTWLLEKWRIALETFPIELTNQGAVGRLVRTTIGVGIARLYGFAITDEQDELDEKFFQALQMGFYYGIAYALVDGLQDNQEQIDIDTWLKKMEDILCGGEQMNLSSLPELPMTPLLLETFHSLIQLTSKNFITVQTFTDLALLLRSQRIDKKDLNRSDYNDIDIFIGPLLKAHFTYTATVYMSGAKILTNDQRLWLMPFLGQLTDDCRDFHEDRQTKSITPITYYAQHNGVTLNPFFVFLFICEDLYLESNRENNTGAFLGRRIMRTLRAIGSDLKEFLQIFTSTSYPDLCKYCLSLEYLFNHISDPEKTIFRHINTFAKNYSYNHRTLETFAYDYLPIIEKELFIDTNNDNNPLIHGMNHSLKAGGKRLRPLLLLMVAQLYNIDIKRILPLARAIEYLHTSSLIFDDLPAQDNAPLRRGKPTLHMTIDSDYNNIPSSLTGGRAQLAAIDLIGYAIQLVTIDLHNENFSYESINRVTAELAQSMKELCYGQFLDLQSARNEKLLTINELDRIAYLKTGKAIEVTLICPVLLVEQKQSLDELRQLGRLMGILFQMKDDLLDLEGHTDQLGKLQNIDQQNQTITYINLLGIEGTRQRIQEIRKQAELILDNLWSQSNTIRDVIRYICERKK
ncbi:unnamed protein product, partial [Adineta steineri]